MGSIQMFKTTLLITLLLLFTGCFDTDKLKFITTSTQEDNHESTSTATIITPDTNDSNSTSNFNTSTDDTNTQTDYQANDNTPEKNPIVDINITTLKVDAGSNKSARIGELVMLVAHVEGAQGSVTYSWLEDEKEIATTQYLSKNDWSVGEHNITLIVTDESSTQAQDNVRVTIEEKLIIEDKTLQERGGWGMVIKVDNLILNETSGSFESLTYQCGGDLTYLSPQDEGYLFDEELLYGLQNCEAGCQIWINQDGSTYQKLCNGQILTAGKLSTPLNIELYQKIEIVEASAGMDHNASDILYATQSGDLYALNPTSGDSTMVANLTPNYLVQGLAYHQDELYYYSYRTPPTEVDYANYWMEKVDLNTTIVTPLSATLFPDGLDIYNDTLYSVTQDVSGIITLFDLNGTYLSKLDTGIDDIVGISHTQYFFYILSEDGDIYQTNPQTGESKRIFNNDNLFEESNNQNGLEAITIFNDYAYVSYINDSSIYKIDVNLTIYE